MLKQQIVLVTGSNGLLGSNIVHRLISEGYKVIAFLRKGSNRISLKDIDYELAEGELDNINHLEKAIKGCDYVIHCAAKTGQTGKLKDYQQININATGLLIQLCKVYKIKRFVYISTANCFTNGTLKNPGNELSGFMPWLQKSGYAYSKYIAQQMVINEAKYNEFPSLVLVPTFLIGPGDAKKSSGRLLLHGLKRRIVFYPSGGKCFVDTEYAAKATVNALTIGKIGECYLLAGENLSYKQFFNIIKRNYNSKAILIKLPDGLIKMTANIFSLIQWLLSLSLTLNNTNWRLLCLNNYFSNNKAKMQLDLKQTNTEEAIKKAYAWFKDNNYL